MAQLTPFLAKLKHSRSDQVTRAVIEKNYLALPMIAQRPTVPIFG